MEYHEGDVKDQMGFYWKSYTLRHLPFHFYIQYSWEGTWSNVWIAHRCSLVLNHRLLKHGDRVECYRFLSYSMLLRPRASLGLGTACARARRAARRRTASPSSAFASWATGRRLVQRCTTTSTPRAPTPRPADAFSVGCAPSRCFG